MKKLPVILSIIVVLASLYWWYSGQMKPKTEMNIPVEMTEPAESVDMPESVKTYMLSDIEKHAVKTDCWFAVEGKVYDVTKFIQAGKHPGGEAVIEGCGKDATVLFDTRPMGSGTPHSEKARGFLASYYIGDLE